MIGLVFNAIDEGTRQGFAMLWGILISILKANWPIILAVLFALFVIATFKAMMGRWGSFGSLLYNSLYFGVLFMIGLIWGPEVFTGNFFDAFCAVILYPICYFVTGLVLDKIRTLRSAF